MRNDDDFTPKLGRIRARGGKDGRRYAHRVLRAISLAGKQSAPARTRFHGSRIGRGAGVGRVLAARDRYAALRIRRVVIKSRIVKLAGQGLQAARLHLRYIQRDGITRDGLEGELYDAASDRADGKAFLERCEGDRHQFRFIVSAEDAAEYDDLKGFTRRLMRQMEEDLGTRLDWVAVDHHNTGHPHSHIVLRGKDDKGKDLIIARAYLSRGMRERASEIVTFDLGERSTREIEGRLRKEVEQERFTGLDRSLLREVGEDGLVRSGGAGSDAFRQSLRAGRLQTLRRMVLAEEVAPGAWRLDSELEPVLRRMGERGDIIKTIHREMARAGRARAPSDYAIHVPDDPAAGRLVGRIAARGLSDEIEDRHYLIVDALDGRTHYVDIGRADAAEPLPEGAVIAIAPKTNGPRPADRTVAEIAAANDGRYSVDIHLRHDPGAAQAFAEAHLRRLEALRRAGAGVEREPDGTWIIASDHLERAAAYERGRARANPVTVETLSTLPLDRQITAEGATWLDRELLAEAPEPARDAGFGREVRRTLAQRRQWLIEQGLAKRQGDRIVYRAGLLGLLRRRELTQVAARLAKELGLPYAETTPGARIEGTFRRRLELASGSFALIEKSHEFTLVPWREVLERSMGKRVSGIMRGEAVSWEIGRKRGIGIG